MFQRWNYKIRHICEVFFAQACGVKVTNVKIKAAASSDFQFVTKTVEGCSVLQVVMSDLGSGDEGSNSQSKSLVASFSVL